MKIEIDRQLFEVSLALRGSSPGTWWTAEAFAVLQTPSGVDHTEGVPSRTGSGESISAAIDALGAECEGMV